MTHSSAPAAALGLLAFLLAAAAPAAADDQALLRPPFLSEPPLVTDTPEDIVERTAALTEFPTKLDPRLWTAEHVMRPEIAARAMAVVHQLFAGLKLHNPAVTVADIELFGSNASYEYDEQADLGFHVFLSTARNPAAYGEDVKDLERFMKLFTDTIELEQKGQVSFFGIPVEIVFHATRSPGYRDSDGLPQYSVWSSDAARTGRWINPRVPPPAPPKNAFDRDVIARKAEGFSVAYNALVLDYFKDKRGFDCHRFVDLEKAMKTYRSDGIATDGQRSDGNLTYRLMRRLSVNVPDTAEALVRECRNIKESLF